MRTEPTRQVHLDFHTSEHLPDIGGEFTKEQFAHALNLGHVNAINVFAKCHHSWSYYPTKIGRPHPNLRTDLLGGQIEAAHSVGATAPIYFTMGWSAADAEEHPQWCVRDRNGQITTSSPWPDGVGADAPKPTFQWKDMCPTGEYHELVVAQTEELCDLYPVDGFFYDIYKPEKMCFCETCRAGMDDAGIDIDDPRAVEAYRAGVFRTHCDDLRRVILGKHPNASIYFNGLTTIDRPINVRYRLFDANTKNDLEDLPTTWGGYDKFPLRAKVFLRERKPVVAMSGKFHTAWGEFGGFKDPEALRFEAASMIAFGASCNFGDHLHPDGRMDLTTYENLGHAFAYVRTIEEYGPGAQPAASLGVWAAYDEPADEGLVRMLLEEQIDFDVVAAGDDLSRFEAIVVPSHPGVLDSAREQIAGYLAGGGKLLVLGRGALNADETETAVDCGLAYVGPGRYDCDYSLVCGPIVDASRAAVSPSPDGRARALPATPFLNYTPAARFAPVTGSAQPDASGEPTILATIQEPHFSRTYGRYCGHQNTPNRTRSAEHPAAWTSGNTTVIAHDIDRIYHAHGSKVHRVFFATILKRIHTRPMIEATLPSAGRVSLLHQSEHRRYVAHILYGAPLQRGNCLVIEDLPELRGVTLRLRLPETVTRLRVAPSGEALSFSEIDGARGKVLEVVVPPFSAHTAVVAEY